jgi:hypothetical protein
MRCSLRIVALVLLSGAIFLVAGCNYAVPAMWIAQGPPKKPAEFTLPKDKKLVVFVDDRKSVVCSCVPSWRMTSVQSSSNKAW